jgi:hypothetical protein
MQVLWTNLCYFIKRQSFPHFTTTFKLGMRQGLHGHTSAQKHGDLKDNCNAYKLPAL